MQATDAIAEAVYSEVSEYLTEDLNLSEDDFDLDISVDVDTMRCRVYVDVDQDKDSIIQRRHQREKHNLQERLTDNLPGVRALVMFSRPMADSNLAYAESLSDTEEECEDDMALTNSSIQYREEGLQLVEYDPEEDELRSIEELEDDEELYQEGDEFDDEEDTGEGFNIDEDEDEDYVPDDEDEASFYDQLGEESDREDDDEDFV